MLCAIELSIQKHGKMNKYIYVLNYSGQYYWTSDLPKNFEKNYFFNEEDWQPFRCSIAPILESFGIYLAPNTCIKVSVSDEFLLKTEKSTPAAELKEYLKTLNQDILVNVWNECFTKSLNERYYTKEEIFNMYPTKVLEAFKNADLSAHCYDYSSKYWYFDNQTLCTINYPISCNSKMEKVIEGIINKSINLDMFPDAVQERIRKILIRYE